MSWKLADIEKLALTGKIRSYNIVGGGTVDNGKKVAKNSKMGNIRVVVDGIKFQSKKESCRYRELMSWQELGIISFVNIQVRFKLSVCEYWADFVYLCDGEVVIEDVKSSHTRQLPVYRLKKKMMLNELSINIKEI